MGAGRTIVRTQARRRWSIVLAAVVLLTSVPIAINKWPARATDIRTGALRERIAASARQPYQGYAQSIGLLPLPPLPNLEQVTALVSARTEMRTWYAARDRWRVDVIDGGSERDLYQAPDAQYIWDYGANQLSKIVGDQPIRLPRAADLTPPDLARRLLDVATGDRFAALAGKRVAGLAAAGLRIVPSTPATTVSHIDIWADPGTGLPLQAEVTAKGGVRPVFVTRFLEVHLSAPAAEVLTPPTPRPGMGFTVSDAPDILSALYRRRPVLLPDRLAGSPRRGTVAGQSVAGVYGTGLAQFVAVALPGRFGSQAYHKVATFGQDVKVPAGSAALISTGLLTVLVVHAQRTFLVAGFVQPAVLRQVAADLSGAAA
jgi:hypothetical protein